MLRLVQPHDIPIVLQVAGDEPALPNFGEMLWNSRGHDVKHSMEEFSDTPPARKP